MQAHTFTEWWEKHGRNYEAAVIANGDEPWTRNPAKRRALWQRRYSRPAPPAGMARDPRKPEHTIEYPQEQAA